MEWKTRVTEKLGVKYPIMLGALHIGGTSQMAVPVSEAGGLGIITAGALRTPEKLRDDFRRAKQMTDKPLGVNISIGYVEQPEVMAEVVVVFLLKFIVVFKRAVFFIEFQQCREQGFGHIAAAEYPEVSFFVR